LTSSTRAPASTCATASPRTAVISPDVISAVSRERPVGLIRSPMTTNGDRSPISTSTSRPRRTVVATLTPAA
jgi:hypothetical protein